jgi:mannose-1-phosphate guanylyltransferase
LNAGFARAETGAVVTFGIKPDRPETGYGYIRCGEEVAGGPPRVRRGLSFHEKPDAGKARVYVASGDYFWNSGMFVWRADRFFSLANEVCPDAAAAACLRAPVAAGETGEVAKIYGGLAATSVDYAFMEKLSEFEVVETDCGWDDIGSFDALERVLAANGGGNVGHGDVITLGGAGNIAVAGGRRPVVLLDAEELVVIDAGDVVLVYPKGRGQEVRRAVAFMKEHRPDLL